MTDKARVRKIARERFGYEALRKGQEGAIASVLEGRDTLAVMPTGSGKSAIYQIAGLLMDGPTVVVSPLIALQKDQLDTIEEQEVAPAAVLNSVIPESERREAFEDLHRDLEFLFLAPEQFNKQETIDRVKQAKPSLFVVDEAHCISEWGHDFRPDYLKLGAVIEALGHPTTLALTATANPSVREEITQRLGMRDPSVIVRGFDRPNIWMGVRTFPHEAAKREALLAEVEQTEKPGIIYVSSRRNAEEIANELNARGIKAAYYHGGMRTKERGPTQNDFMSGESDVIVATSAFGMGVDKPNVRFVFHHDISDSLDSYYQEIGRAGRDGRSARAILFYRAQNLNIHRFFKGGGKVNAGEIGSVIAAVEKHPEPVKPDDLRAETGLSKLKLARAIARLEEAGALEKLATGEVRGTNSDADAAEVCERAAAEQERLQEYSRLRIEKMQAYAELTGCRREYLLRHFGEDAPPACEACDNCDSGKSRQTAEAQQEAASSDQPFAVKSRVAHRELGKGIVQGYEGNRVVVLFDEAGKKTLSLDAVQKNGLLEAAG